MKKFRLYIFAIIACALLAIGWALQASNPQVPRGGTASFARVGTEGPASAETWDIVNSAGTVVAKASLSQGWTVSFSGTSFTVGAPTTAAIATNYKVRYGNSIVIGFALRAKQRLSGLPKTVQTGGGASAPWTGTGKRASNLATPPPPPMGGNSATFDVVAGGAPPAAPSNLTATTFSASRINLAWTDNSSDETGFKIERKQGTGGWSQIGTVGAGVTTYGSVGLLPNTAYTYRVRATNPYGDSAFSNEAAATTQNGPVPPASTYGTEFWLTYPGNQGDGGDDDGVQVFKLYITSETGATGTVTVPGASITQNFTVTAGGQAIVDLPKAVELDDEDGIGNNGVRVVSDNPVGVQVLNFLTWQAEGYTAIPVASLGTDHVVMAWPNTLYNLSTVGMRSQVSVVATQNATQVTITPAVNCGTGRLAGTPYTISLNAGQTYQVRASATDADLTGTIVVSDRPVAVMGGAQLSYVPTNVRYANQVVEQTPPTNLWGTSFVANALSTRSGGSIFRVLASRSNTQVRIGGTLVATLRRGQFYQALLDGPVYFQTTKPALVAQFSRSAESDFNTMSDPFMALVPAVTQHRPVVNFVSPGDLYIPLHRANVTVPTAAVATVLLDGQPVPSTAFTAVGGSTYSVAQLELTPGIHRLTTTEEAPLGVISYGYSTYEGYGFSPGWVLPNNAPPLPAPAAPTALTATAASASQINLAWTDNASNEEGFTIERKVGATGTWTFLANVAANVTTYQNTGLNPRTAYVYRVRAFADLDSAWSNEATATTFDVAPAAPSGLTATAFSDTRIDLAWTDASDNEQGFKIERKQGAGSWAEVGTVGAGIRTWQSTGLTKKTAYTFRVRAHNAIGNSAYSNEASATTKDSPPNAPSGLTATAVAWNQVSLAWADNSDNEQGFKIERKVGSSSFVEIASVGANTPAFADFTTDGATAYTYRVRAYNDGGDSGYSNEASVITLNPPPPSAPSGLVATAVSDLEIRLNWTDTSSNETGFVVQRKSGSTWIQVGTVSANTTQFLNQGLSPSTLYVYRVCAANAGGSSAWSNEASATTFAATSGPSYLSGLELSRRHTLVAGTYTGTVYLNARSTSPTVVQLGANHPSVSVPSSVVVPANSLTSSFNYQLSASTSDPRIAVVSAKANGWAQREYVNVLASQPAFSGFKVTPGNGQILVSWNRFPDFVYGNVVVTRQKLNLSTNALIETATYPTQGNAFLDTNVTSAYRYAYQVQVVTQGNEPIPTATASQSAVPTATGNSLAWVGSPLTQDEEVVYTASQSASAAQTYVFIDGVVIGEAEQTPANTLTACVSKYSLASGAHTVRIVADYGTSVASTSTQTISNTESVRNLDVDLSMVRDNGDLVGVSAKVPLSSSWTVEVADETTGTVLRSWSGTSFNGDLRVAWDGMLSNQTTPAQDGSKKISISIDGKKYPRISSTSNANPNFLLLLDRTYQYNNPVDRNYATFLKGLLETNLPAGAQGVVRAKVLYLPGTRQIPEKTRNDIKNWIKSHLDSFYLYSHGNSYNMQSGLPYTYWGDIRFYSFSFTGGTAKDIDIRNLIGSRYYRFVWIDACFSAGGNPTNGNIGAATTAWADAFRVFPSLYSDVFFLGWNGYEGTNYNTNGTESDWYRWRRRWWTEMINQNANAYDAFTLADGAYPSTAIGIKPFDTNGSGVPRRTMRGAPIYFKFY